MKKINFTFLLAILAFFGFTASAVAQSSFTVNTVGATAFAPTVLIIDVGDTVTWVNTGGSHNVNGTQATYPNNPESFGGFAVSGTASPNWPFTHVFTIPGKYEYRCDPHVGNGMAGAVVVRQPIMDCQELFISEYIEGSSNNKALEFYNPTDNPINLEDYFVMQNSNSGPFDEFLDRLGGTVAPKDVFVVHHASADPLIAAVGDTVITGVNFFNGDDARLLAKIVTDSTQNDTIQFDIDGIAGDETVYVRYIDLIGDTLDPGSQWTVIGTNGTTDGTQNNTLVRDASIGKGNTTHWNLGVGGDEAPAGEWEVYPQNTFSFLGSHVSAACAAGPGGSAYTLQILHSSDLEGGIEALGRAANYAAIIDSLEGEYDNTVVISSGDNYIPGPFFNAASDGSLRPVLDYVYQNALGLPSGNSDIRNGNGRVDISIMNVIGFDASAIGNHEFDAGANIFGDLIQPDIRTGPSARWLGAQFPYISANLDFSGDFGLSSVYTNSILPNTDFASDVNNLSAASSAPRLAPATIINRNGEKIGVVGATTQLLENITSSGNVSVIGGGNNDMVQLASVLQPYIDSLVQVEGANKIILTTHLQQFSLEQQLIGLLREVDIVIAGGSDFLLADGNDALLPGDVAQGPYPFPTLNADGDSALIISTDGQYKYVGRLVVDFDSMGKVIPSSVSDVVSGAYASTTATVNSIWGSDNPLAMGTKAFYVDTMVSAVEAVVTSKDAVILGKTDVYLEGRREFVRTEETNLGNLTADANLTVAKQFDSNVLVSIKNGGGIRAEIGEVAETSPGVYEYLPPQANPLSGKDSLEISQLDIENSLKFNNRLSVLDLSAADIKELIESGVSQSAPGSTPGRFPQVGGLQFSYDYNLPAGNRVVDMFVRDLAGNNIDTIAMGGMLMGDTSRVIKTVTLNFLADGNDGYDFDILGENRVDLDTASVIASDTGNIDFTLPGSEQDALAEYLIANHSVVPFNLAETPVDQDMRIINLAVQPPTTGPCTDLFISEYMEGSGNNKAVEVYNPTNSMVNLSGYVLQLVGNGGNFTNTFNLDGMLAPKETYVISTDQADSVVQAFADTSLAFPSIAHFNGDDAFILLSPSGDTLDIFGTPGFDPGSAWDIVTIQGDTVETRNITLIRAPFVQNGGTDWNTVQNEWFALPIDESRNLKQHNAEDCGSTMPAYLISQLKGLDANLAPDSVGVMAQITGLVLNPDQGFNSSEFAIQDGSAGIWVTGADPIVGYGGATEGDIVKVYGTVSFGNGVTRFAADSIFPVASYGNLHLPVVYDTLNEETEGQYVKLDSVRIINNAQDSFDITGGGNNYTIVTQQLDTFTMRVDRDYELDFEGNPVPTGLFNVRGVGGQFDGSAPHNSNYQIFPSRYSDLEILTIVGDFIGFSNATDDVLENAGTYQLLITTSDTLSQPATVDVVNTNNGTAVLGTDFNFNDTTLSFSNTGIDTFLLDITIIDNSIVNPDKTVELALRNISGAQYGLDTVFALTIINEDIPTYDLATIRGNNTDGVADSIGVYCKTLGVVHSPNFGGTGFSSYYIQDGTGSLNLYSPNFTALNEGDSVRAIGPVIQFNGLSEIEFDSIVVISSGNPLPAPATVTTLDEFAESRLVRMENMTFLDASAWYNGGSSFNIDMTNGIDTFTMRIDSDMPLADSVNPPAEPFNVIGVGGQFDGSSPYTSGYQIFPRFWTDFELFVAPIPTYNIGSVTTVDAQGIADSTGVTCKLEGIVYGENFRAGLGGLEFTLIDGTNTDDGIAVFSSAGLGYTVTEGDEVRVIGTIDQLFGLTRIVADSVVLISSGNTLKTPSAVTALDEFSESNLVEISPLNYIAEGNWTGTGANFDVRFTNGTDTFTVRIDDDCNLYSAAEPSAILSYEIVGIGGQADFASPFDEGYLLLPRRSTDITPLGAIDGAAINGTMTVYPNPAKDVINIRRESVETVEIVLVDIMGRTVAQTESFSKQTELNVSNVPAGQYFLQIRNDKEFTTVKVVITE
jgi:2',3'-cyclic-nucleotide 2'-phosphodiesterase (5'-nucleotidase family)/plastocyanin